MDTSSTGCGDALNDPSAQPGAPKMELLMDELSMSENTGQDILPWNVATAGCPPGREPSESAMSDMDQDLSDWPLTLISIGGIEVFGDAVRRFVG
jgi:hypothetical protein